MSEPELQQRYPRSIATEGTVPKKDIGDRSNLHVSNQKSEGTMGRNGGSTKQQTQLGLPCREEPTIGDLECPLLRISSTRPDSACETLSPVSSRTNYFYSSENSDWNQRGQNLAAGMRPESELNRLASRIEGEMAMSKWPVTNMLFLPIDKLHEFVERSVVQNELNIVDCCGENKISSRRDHESICDTIIGTRGKLFVILAMMNELPMILALIDEGVQDGDLPFFLEAGNNAERHLCRYVEGGQERIRSFEDHHGKWSASLRIQFYQHNQWQVLSPCFSFSSISGHEKLQDDKLILPFIEEWMPDDPIMGGTCAVRKVKIHIAHQKHHADNQEGVNPFYALKSLATHLPVEDCKAEIMNLQRFVDQDQDRLVRLLCAFQHKKQFHLIFPWADANLLDFWTKEYPGADTPPRDQPLARWMSKVILGLAEGLQMIHGAEVPGSTEKNRGRHGDLKPQNILWFKDPGCDSLGYPTGVLQICDFGLADFHSTQSTLVPARNIEGWTQTYRAPEWDFSNPISPSYDIWSLGCVLLEFVTWYMLGAKGVVDFEDKRVYGSPEIALSTRGDNFFILHKESGCRGSRVTEKKAVMKHIKDLKKGMKGSHFLLDVLKLIERNLLQIKPAERLECPDIVKKLREIHDRCEDPEYCAVTRHERKVVRRGRSFFQAFIQCC